MRDKTHILAAMCPVSRTKRRGSVGAGSASESNGSRIEGRGERGALKPVLLEATPAVLVLLRRTALAASCWIESGRVEAPKKKQWGLGACAVG